MSKIIFTQICAFFLTVFVAFWYVPEELQIPAVFTVFQGIWPQIQSVQYFKNENDRYDWLLDSLKVYPTSVSSKSSFFRFDFMQKQISPLMPRQPIYLEGLQDSCLQLTSNFEVGSAHTNCKRVDLNMNITFFCSISGNASPTESERLKMPNNFISKQNDTVFCLISYTIYINISISSPILGRRP